MHSRSYGAVGVAEICQRADVRKGSFYHFFPSKQELTLEAVAAHWDRQRAGWSTILQVEDNGSALERLRRLLGAMAAEHRAEQQTHGAVGGCVLANLALELSTQDQAVQDRLQAIFAEQIALIEALLQEAVAEGSIPASGATRANARAVVAQIEGMVLFAKLGNDPAVLDDLWPQTLRLLQTTAREAGAPASLSGVNT